MSGKRADTFRQLMDRITSFTLRRAWNDLTDDEFFWNPTPDAWSVRRRGDCKTPNPFGDGDWVADFAVPEPGPVPPMTTIAWLYWHIGSMPARLADIEFLGGSRQMSTGWTSPYLAHHPMFTNATDAVSAFHEGWETLRGAIERTDDDGLEVLAASYTYAAEAPQDGLCVLGPPGPVQPAGFFVAGTLNEISHHGTQICTLRDLYASRH
jgi:hypothetical protein